MDIKAYIESGILESYILGETTSQETQAISCLSKIYPEINEEIQLIESSLEKYIQNHSVSVPSEIKSAVLTKIQEVKQEKSPLKIVTSSPQEKEERYTSTASNYSIYALAASVALLIGVSYFFIQERNENKALASNLTEVQSSNEEKINAIESKLALAQKREDIIFSANTSKTALNETGFVKNANASIYWNTSTKQALLVYENIPTANENQDYQLWAIVNGVPMDLGIFHADDTNPQIIACTFDKVDAFGITLEPKGGSKSPTLSQLVVIGNV